MNISNEDDVKWRLDVAEKELAEANAKLQALELVVVCATDIVAAWPSLTMRLLGSMTNRVDTLKQALENVKVG